MEERECTVNRLLIIYIPLEKSTLMNHRFIVKVNSARINPYLFIYLSFNSSKPPLRSRLVESLISRRGNVFDKGTRMGCGGRRVATKLNHDVSAEDEIRIRRSNDFNQ